MITDAQKDELAALAEQRPTLIAVEGSGADRSFVLAPADVEAVDPADGDTVRILARFFAILATDTSQRAQLHALGRLVLPLVERAGRADATLAVELADLFEQTGVDWRTSVRRDVEGLARRLRALAAGTCGCDERPLPYATEPDQYPLLEHDQWKRIAEEGYVTTYEQRARCVVCGAHFVVRKTVDYDRPTWSWTKGPPEN